MTHSSKIKTAAIYDRWFFRMGGGERMVCALLSSLHAQGIQVTLLSPIDIDLSKASVEFGMDLGFVTTKLVPDLQEDKLGFISRGYDLFINASHLDIVPSEATSGVLLPFFPARPARSLKEKIKLGLIIPLLRNLFVYPQRMIGFTNDFMLSSRSIITFSTQKLATLELVLAVPQFCASFIESVQFFCGDTQLFPSSSADVIQKKIRYQFENLEFLRDQGIRIQVPKNIPHEKVRLESIHIPSVRFIAWKLFATLFPGASVRLTGGASLDFIDRLSTYQQIWAISEYTKHWINAYWGKESKILFPSVAVDSFSCAKKKSNTIIHIGRFFSGGHSKKQLELVTAFRQLVDEGLVDWELHLVGKPASETIHQQYFARIQSLAAGYPIVFHPAADTKELKRLLSTAKIYWHATGFQEDLQLHPEAAEHFGLSTVEAMASGCVPVVFAAGGQQEIVSTQEGYTWKTIEELKRCTKNLIEDPKQLATLSSQAMVKARSYDTKQFEARLKDLLHHL